MSASSKNLKHGSFRVWMMAARIPTLPAAIAPVIVGTAMAHYMYSFDLVITVLAMFGAITIQIGANMANDYSDFRKGADNAERIGPIRVTQQGLLSEKEILVGASISFGVSTLIGLYFFYIVGWPILVIGALSLLAAVTYTGGPWPFGYNGLGDLFVFIFFGLIAVCATFYVQVQTINIEILLLSIPIACLVTAILIVNNIRDIETDRRSKKYTLAVYFGLTFAKCEYIVLLVVAYITPLVLIFFGILPLLTLIFFFSFPLCIKPVIAVLYRQNGPSLNSALKGTALVHLSFAILISVGLFW
jgi:1,4-dihydroxy-2-naphthoate octaprenyltransferase